MTVNLGRVTQVSPLRVRLNGESVDTPAEGYAGLITAVDKEVAVQTVEGRRLIVWAAS